VGLLTEKLAKPELQSLLGEAVNKYKVIKFSIENKEIITSFNRLI
jgi:hypothetical protein